MNSTQTNSTHTAIASFLPGDVVFLASKGDLPGRLGNWIAQSRGERPTYAVHTAQFLDAGTILEMDHLAEKRNLGQLLKRRRGFEVWRRRGLTAEQRQALTGKALFYFGMKFGWPKLVTHVLDGLINKITRKEVFFFRRLNHNDRYPLCSWITAFAYDRALHYRFGAPPECADPDQMHDWVTTHPMEWTLIFRYATKMMPVSATRLGILRRPSFGIE
jgi:hypothetical protein